MSKTRFMTVLFSATEKGDEELTKQVHEDIQKAKENGSFEDDEMEYRDLGEKGVLATDKECGEHTLIHNDPVITDGDVVIDLEEIPDYCVEDLVHPEVSENEGSFVMNPMEGKEFSVKTENTAVLKIFSDQDLVETVSESVTRTEQDAQVGDLKFEKDSDDDCVVVTDLSSGDKAKVVLDGEDMKVTELDQKNFKYYSNKENMNVIRRKVFSHAEQYEPIFVVGIDPINKVLVNSPVYGEEAANDLAGKLAERGIVGVSVFTNPDEGRDYALSLLEGNGATEVAEAEEMQVAYSDDTVVANRYFSDRTRFMNRLFSEAEDNVTDHQDLIESAISDGDQMETEDFIITPVSDDCAVVEDKDNGEYTVAELDGEDINVDEISAEQAQDMMKDVEIEDEKEFSDKPYRKCYGLVSRVAEKVAKAGQRTAAKGKEIGSKVRDAKTLKEQEKLAAKANKLMTRGENIEKNAKTIAKVGLATAGAAAAAGTGAAGYKLTRKQKENSDVDDATLAQVEDKATEAIQNVQEAAETAIDAINQAKEAPVENPDDVKEATYSATTEEGVDEVQKLFSEVNDTNIYNPSLKDLNW